MVEFFNESTEKNIDKIIKPGNIGIKYGVSYSEFDSRLFFSTSFV